MGRIIHGALHHMILPINKQDDCLFVIMWRLIDDIRFWMASWKPILVNHFDTLAASSTVSNMFVMMELASFATVYFMHICLQLLKPF
jgi:hypothetical protein